jgi:hypothetical protein
MLFGNGGPTGPVVATVLAISAVPLLFDRGRVFAEEQGMVVLAQASSGPLRCEIRKNQAGGAVELTGIIGSSRAVAGSFRFTVTKSGASGSSNIHQANKFDLAAGQETQVGAVKINLDRGAHGAIELVVTSDDGLECRAGAALES